MPTFAEFLNEMESITSIRVTPFDRAISYGAHHVLVGRGKVGTPSLCLNNKAYVLEGADQSKSKFGSVTQLLTKGPIAILDGFALWADRPLTPRTALERVILVVEDASPDSVFGIFLALARVFGVDLSEIPSGWIHAAHEWETAGNCHTPHSSWCALESALCHSQFPIGSPVSAEVYSSVWAEALHFLVVCLKRGLEPEGIVGLVDIPEYEQAVIALKNNEETYLDWLTHAHIIQLSLPLVHGNQRRTMVDGLLVVEDAEAGAARSFYRNDSKNSPLGHGFALAAHYRPTVEPGDEFTITVDPRTGVHLLDLWNELERRETEAWAECNETRPSDNPRLDISVEPKVYNEPWFVNDNRTMIAAPRQLADDVKFGTRLSWSDVCDAIWTVYNPLNSIQVSIEPDSALLNIGELPPIGKPIGSKRLFIAHWPKGTRKLNTNVARSLPSAPIVLRAIAALIDRGNGPKTLTELPATKNWAHVDLSGGFAVATSKGAFVLEDWREQPLDIEQVRRAFEQAAKLDNALAELNLRKCEKHTLKRGPLCLLVDEVEEALSGKPHDLEKLQRKAGRIRAEAARLRGLFALPPEDADSRLLRASLDNHWGLERRLDAVDKEVSSLEASLKTLVELRTVRVTRLIGIYGFPIFVATPLGEPIAKVLAQMQGNTTASPLSILATMAIIAVALMLVIRLGIWLENPLRAE